MQKRGDSGHDLRRDKRLADQDAVGNALRAPLGDRQRAEVAARIRESNKHSGMSDAELDTYEGLLRDGRSDEANDFFARCQSEMLVRIFINDGGMTEDEARRYLVAHLPLHALISGLLHPRG